MKKNYTIKFALLITSIFFLVVSITNAQSWNEINTGGISSDISCFVTDGDSIYAGSEVGGVYMTSNNPINWTNISNGFGTDDVNAVLKFDNMLYAGTYGYGVYRSKDGGDTWSQIDTGWWQTSIYVNDLFAFNGFLFAAADDGGYISADSGSHWQPVTALSLQ